ncbi:DNA polymerase lambda isoform X2 [Rhodamnia argentea]|uniref:DNA polymerase n=1 Tax=Rhodamnia argentea TaxID=178133 RepID=A0A8B8QY83_9MYRT|nr:DNA polymerase lambda isoform X2 [Rhodamnia argentea]
MAPKRKKEEETPPSDPNGIFSGMVVFLVESGVQPRRLQIWKRKLTQMGANVVEKPSKGVTHVLAVDADKLLRQLGEQRLERFKGRILLYQWLEESLRSGEKVSEDMYDLKLDLEKEKTPETPPVPKPADGGVSKGDESSQGGSIRCPPQKNAKENDLSEAISSSSLSDDSSHSLSSGNTSTGLSDITCKDGGLQQSSLIYSPPDLNRNVTEIFVKLINIYRALGDDRRSFSYYKAISVIEKLPFKIDSGDQVKNLPSIGKALQEHIQEIVTTGKLSKLEHFETDEKVRTISLFGEVWGIGPTTALKLYEKGYRTLDELKKEESLTHAQRLGLKYFDDIKQRIPRDEAQEMEQLLQKAGEDVLPGVVVLCGGSYRRGKPSCGDLDVVITHPDGKSHRGFLKKYVKHLKDLGFLREDLVFSTDSEEGTDSGVDTYFGLCTYPGRELCHRIDFKVYPRDIYAFGLIAWTGNDVLNRRLRLLAKSKGFRLDDTGLFPGTHDSGGKRGSKGSTSIKLYTEREVFDFLGFPWLEPHERNL